MSDYHTSMKERVYMNTWSPEVIESVVSEVRERWGYREVILVCLRFERDGTVGIITKGLYDSDGGLNILGTRETYTICWLCPTDGHVTDDDWESYECSGDFYEYGSYEDYMNESTFTKKHHPEYIWVDIEGA